MTFQMTPEYLEHRIRGIKKAIRLTQEAIDQLPILPDLTNRPSARSQHQCYQRSLKKDLAADIKKQEQLTKGKNQ
tara:strand:+ start:1348 stop:1572 length:225 start_codon:yes stop_codon:yes gene_type:complete